MLEIGKSVDVALVVSWFIAEWSDLFVNTLNEFCISLTIYAYV